MSWQSYISDTAVQAMGWTIFHSIWQGSLIVILLSLVFAYIKNATVRYNVALMGMLALLMAFIITFTYEYDQLLNATVEAVYDEPIAEMSAVDITTQSMQDASFISWFRGSLQKTEQWIEPYIPIIVYLWIFGAIVFALRLMGGYLYLLNLSKSRVHPLPSEWLLRFEQLKSEMGIRRPLRWLVSERVEEPLSLFHLKPVILFPVGLLSGLTPEQVETILIHEMAHIRRADYLVNILQSIIEIVLFYHPAVWWISGRIRQERESCCDDQVMAFGMDPFSYAEALTHVQSFYQSTKPMLTMSAIGKKGHFAARIQRLFGHYPQQSSKGKSLLSVAILMMGMTAFAFQHPANENVIEQTVPVKDEVTVTFQPNVVVRTNPSFNFNVSSPQVVFGTQASVEVQDPKQSIVADRISNTMVIWRDGTVHININASTTANELEELKSKLKRDGIEIVFANTVWNSEGKLTEIAGYIKFPDGASGKFRAKSEDKLQVQIMRHKNDNEWDKLHIRVNNGKEDGNSISGTSEPAAKVISAKSAPAIAGKIKHAKAKPLIVLDGTVKGKDFDIESVNSENVESINVWKGEWATEKYGEDAVDGVVEIQTKEKNTFVHAKEKPTVIGVIEEPADPSGKVVIRADNGQQPLYVLDGIPMEGKFVLELHPEKIESVTVLKGKSAKAIYGEKGENGVIVIETKKNSFEKTPQTKPEKLPELVGEQNIFESSSDRKLSNVKVYPNKFQDEITIEYDLKVAGEVSVEITTVDGRSILKGPPHDKPANHVTQKVNLISLPVGVYLLHIRSGEDHVVKRIVKE